MDIKEYISSGIVELYVLNSLSPEERNEFERNILFYPEIGTELKKVEKALEDYSIAHSVNPRPVLRSIILEAVLSGEKKSTNKEKGKVIQMDYSPTYKYLIAASLAALIVSTFASWFFYSRWDEAEQRYTIMLNQKNELAESYNIVKANYDESTATLFVMRDEDSKVIVLNATDTMHRYQARVYWNNRTHQSYIDILSLPTPDSGKQFQLWALVGGKPKDAGVFSSQDIGLQRLKDVDKADMWAVTLEPKGGSITPTLDQMYLISKSS